MHSQEGTRPPEHQFKLPSLLTSLGKTKIELLQQIVATASSSSYASNNMCIAMKPVQAVDPTEA